MKNEIINLNENSNSKMNNKKEKNKIMFIPIIALKNIKFYKIKF